MSSFTGFNAPLNIEYVKPKRNTDLWKVKGGFEYYLKGDTSATVVIPEGFITDGASVPRPLWWLLPPWGRYGQSAVLHDYLLDVGWVTRYSKVERIVASRKEARRHFVDSMKVVGVGLVSRSLIHLGTFLYDTYKGDRIKRR